MNIVRFRHITLALAVLYVRPLASPAAEPVKIDAPAILAGA